MDKQNLIKKILNRKETRDYSYAVIFFILSTIFAVFAIRPTLTLAFSKQREVYDLTRLNDVYEGNLSKLVEVQTRLEQVRGKVHLLDSAVPSLPETKTIVDDIKRSASQEGLLIKNLSIASVDLKNEGNNKMLKKLSLTMETTTDFKSAKRFMDKLIDQKRLKEIKSLKVINEDTTSTGSGSLRIIMNIEGYFL